MGSSPTYREPLTVWIAFKTLAPFLFLLLGAYAEIGVLLSSQPSSLKPLNMLVFSVLFLGAFAMASTGNRVVVYADGVRPPFIGPVRWLRRGFHRKIQWSEVRAFVVYQKDGIDRILELRLHSGDKYTFRADRLLQTHDPEVARQILESWTEANGRLEYGAW